MKSHQNIPLAKTTTYSYHHCPLGIGGIRLRKILILPLPPPLSPFQKSPFSRLLLNFFFSLSSSISRETTVRHDKISFQISKFRKTDRSKKKKKNYRFIDFSFLYNCLPSLDNLTFDEVTGIRRQLLSTRYLSLPPPALARARAFSPRDALSRRLS